MTASAQSKASSGARQPPQDLVVGRIIRPHGIRGELVVDLSADLLFMLDAGTAVHLGSEKRARRLIRLRRHGKMHLLTLDGLTTRTQAERYRDQPLRLRMSAAPKLPPNVYYHWQIIGLSAETEAGERLGRVAEILETGANDVYVIHDDSGSELLIPAIEDVILHVDLDAGRMTVRLLPGLR